MELNDYLLKVARQHAGLPKFTAVLTALLQPGLDTQTFAQSVVPAFDLDQAVGTQLDIDGVIIGRRRQINVPLAGVYFSFDTPGLGFDQGVWKGPFDPTTGVVVLDDDTYRLLLKAKAAANSWDGTNETAQAILTSVFDTTPGTYIFLDDHLNMNTSLVVSGVLPPAIVLALLTSGFIPLKPGGVSQDVALTSVNGAPVFGFDVNNQYIGGFDVGAWAVDDPSLIIYP